MVSTVVDILGVVSTDTMPATRGVVTAVGVVCTWEDSGVASCKQPAPTAHLGALGGGNSVEGLASTLVLDLKPPALRNSRAFLSSFFINLFNSSSEIIKQYNLMCNAQLNDGKLTF